MSAPTRSSPSDNAVLATLAAAFLIREGGNFTFSTEEWQQAIDHEGVLWVSKEEERVLVAMIQSAGAKA